MDLLRGMSLFVEVARARSFTRAAEKLAMPTSTLSRRIGEIEQSLGLKLLHRTTRSVSLTDAGALYFSRAVSLVEAAEEAHSHVRGLAERPSGLLRVSMEAEIGPTLIAPVIADFGAPIQTSVSSLIYHPGGSTCLPRITTLPSAWGHCPIPG